MTEMTFDHQLFLGRQPILDKAQRLVAYELLFRTGQHNAAHVTDNLRATATVIANAFSELSIADALGTCRGFINVDEDFLFSDLLELLPRNVVVLEILETVRPTPDVVRRCRELKAQGFTLALDDVTQVAPDYRELLDLVEIVKVDIQPLSRLDLMKLSGQLYPLRKQLLAEKVDSREQMELCLKLGYSLFQGYYFAKPSIIAGRKLKHSELALMKLMGLLLSDADTVALEAALKQEPGLSLNLLRLTNSVSAGATQPIASLGHAITVLGRRQLQRWLQLLLFSSSGPHGTSSPLLVVAATRGRLLELLARAQRPQDDLFADQAFMTGIMSLMPAVLGLEIRDIVATLGMAPTIGAALCSSEGKLGDLLRIAQAVEFDDQGALAETLAGLPELTPETVSRCLSQAMAWAGSIGREMSPSANSTVSEAR